MQGAIICSQAAPLFVLRRKKWRRERGGATGEEEEAAVRGRGRERNKWTHLLPKALLLRPIYQKGGGRGILFDWLITRGIHHRPAHRHQFDAAILDNLLGWDDKEVTVALAPARPFIILGN